MALVIDPFLFVKMQLPQLELTAEDIAFATKNDPELIKLHKKILLHSNKYGSYWIRDGCILFGTRIRIPKMLQNYILEYIHIEHVGTIKMIALALSYCVYWPSIDKDIENLVRNCLPCIEIRLAPNKEILHNWVAPKEPWERIHIDYAGPFMDNLFLLVVDEYSLWPEVFISNSSSASSTIEKLKLLFSSFGQPRVLVSDNVSSFMGEEFQTFLKSFGIKHCTGVPYNSKSYDNVVRFIFALKHALIELKGQVSYEQDKLNTLLFTCRRSPIISNIESPANLFLGRDLRSNLDFLKSPAIKNKVMKNENNIRDATPSQLFHFGQKIAVFNNVNGFIINADTSKYLTVMVNGRLIRRHVDKVIPLPVIKSFSRIQKDTQLVQPEKLKRSIKPIKRLICNI
ncbi:uncharacterized protein K02A2.6-like isoform X2 [Acyrthosiphon pisum]|nr:uncharacterized protein K02A2.6-like isoform X2 [Acyrthosiphon pisum]|eukprot:XP_003245258.1 PREDICTED: uncharacterized protein K02A2.6-like isoform X2 [Acyrthosiphon pisum]